MIDFTRAPADLLAEVVVRVGVNLQRGQPLLVTEPYESLGLPAGAAPVVDAVRRAAERAGGGRCEVILSGADRLREAVRRGEWRHVEAMADYHASRLRAHLRKRGAFLFLLGNPPEALADLPAANRNELRTTAWAHLSPIIRRLTAGAAQWTLAPAPTREWAAVVYPDLPASGQLEALWKTVLHACRCTGPDPAGAWAAHLAQLDQRRKELNAHRVRQLRFQGPGTDLRVRLPARHAWCTARLTTATGVPYLVNLPTDELFSAPERNSAEGSIRVSRPVAYAGSVIDGIELEFRRGHVVAASARAGADLLEEILATDPGAKRLGEVALVPQSWESGLTEGTASSRTPRLYHHPLLDENLSAHVALGSAYRFCATSFWSRLALNRSMVHVDLPVAAEATFGAGAAAPRR